jgi:hypothetical protein
MINSGEDFGKWYELFRDKLKISGPFFIAAPKMVKVKLRLAIST